MREFARNIPQRMIEKARHLAYTEAPTICFPGHYQFLSILQAWPRMFYSTRDKSTERF